MNPISEEEEFEFRLRAEREQSSSSQSTEEESPKSNIVLDSVKGSIQDALPKNDNSIGGSILNSIKTVEGAASPVVGPALGIAHDIKRRIIESYMPGKPITSFALNMATDPETYIGLGIAKAGAKKVGPIIKDIVTSGKQLQGIEEQIIKLSSLPTESGIKAGTNKGLSILSQAEKSMVKEVQHSSKQSIEELTSTFKSRREFLENALSKDSISDSQVAKSKIRELIKNMTTIYGEGQKKAEEFMVQRGSSFTKKDIMETLGKTIDDLEVRGIERDNKVFNLIDDAVRKVDELPDDVVSISQARNIKDNFFKAIKASSGHYDANDAAYNQFVRNYGQLLERHSPEMAKLNKEFAPMAEARNWAMPRFRPFSDEEIPHAANLLKSVASGKANPKDIAYLARLEQGKGRFSGTGEIAKESMESGSKITNLKSSFQKARTNLVDSLNYKINQIEKSFSEDKSILKQQGYSDLNDFYGTRGKLSELSMKKEKFEKYKKLRNWAIGLGVLGVGGAPLARNILSAKGLHNVSY